MISHALYTHEVLMYLCYSYSCECVLDTTEIPEELPGSVKAAVSCRGHQVTPTAR